MGEYAKIPIKNIIVKREINPRFELDSDYIEELANSNHRPAVVINKEMVLIDGFHLQNFIREYCADIGWFDCVIELEQFFWHRL